MANAVLVAPMHPREQTKSFAEMSENDNYETPGTCQLQEGTQGLSFKEQSR
jgi:hypothetical protein